MAIKVEKKYLILSTVLKNMHKDLRNLRYSETYQNIAFLLKHKASTSRDKQFT